MIQYTLRYMYKKCQYNVQIDDPTGSTICDGLPLKKIINVPGSNCFLKKMLQIIDINEKFSHAIVAHVENSFSILRQNGKLTPYIYMYNVQIGSGCLEWTQPLLM